MTPVSTRRRDSARPGGRSSRVRGSRLLGCLLVTLASAVWLAPLAWGQQTESPPAAAPQQPAGAAREPLAAPPAKQGATAAPIGNQAPASPAAAPSGGEAPAGAATTGPAATPTAANAHGSGDDSAAAGPNPHAAQQGSVPAAGLEHDTAQAATDLPVGSVEAQLRDAAGHALVGQEIQLEVNFHSIAEGSQTNLVKATTDSRGMARFDGQNVTSDYTYRIVAPSPPATFYSQEFRLNPAAGQRVVQHVYAVSRDMREARVGTRAIVFLQPQDELFRFDVSYRVYNVGTQAWVPQGVVIELPPGTEALTMQENTTDQRVVQINDKLVLEGTYPPGQQSDLRFNFVLQRSGGDKQLITLGLPPRLADLQIIAEAAHDMEMKVVGFSETQSRTHTTGQRLLEVVENYLQNGRTSPPSAKIVLSGLPTPSLGRWVAVWLAVAFVAGGAFVTFSRRDRFDALAAEDASQARRLLLEELVQLERARKAGRVGPRTYEQARTGLLNSLARVEQRLQIPTRQPQSASS